MMDMLKRPISESIQVSWEPSQKLWPIKVDPTQIDRVLANLCVNARYAISGNGHISITTKNCSEEDYFAATQNYETPPRD